MVILNKQKIIKAFNLRKFFDNSICANLTVGDNWNLNLVNTKKGGGIVYFIIIVGIVSTILMGLVTVVVSQVKYSLHTVARAQALGVAEAGVGFYRWYLTHQTDGKTAAQIMDFWENGNPYGINVPYEADFDGRGKYSIGVTPPEIGSTAVTLVVTGWMYGSEDVKRTIRVRLRRPSWSEYAMVVNADVRLGSGTETFGPVHSNGGVRFNGVAHNTVSSTQTTYTDPDTGLTKPGVWTEWAGEYNTSMSAPVFGGGKSFPVAAVDFAGVAADIAMLRGEAQTNGLYFDNSDYGRHLTLRTDGTVLVRRVILYDTSSNAITTEGSAQTYTIPSNSVIYVDDNIWVDGQIDSKKITIVAADQTASTTPNIYIGNDVLYTNYDGTDVIGLIAAGDIEIIRDSEDDLRIDGALMAQTGRVGREHYGTYCTAWTTWWWWTWCTNWGQDIKTTITTYGSIATNQRYGFAWSDGTGYINRNLIYDNNFLYTPPPFFPTGTHYEADLWEEL